MRRYSGNLTIELEDVNTGTIETVSETNMVTNAVNDLLGVNPMGVMYKAGGQYDDSLTWRIAKTTTTKRERKPTKRSVA